MTRVKDSRLETRDNSCCFFKVDRRVYATRTKQDRERWMDALRPLKFSTSRKHQLEKMSHAVMFPEVLDCLKGRVSVVNALKKEKQDRHKVVKSFCKIRHKENVSDEFRKEVVKMLCMSGHWESWESRTSMIRKIVTCVDIKKWLLNDKIAEDLKIAMNCSVTDDFRTRMTLKIGFVKWREYLMDKKKVSWSELVRIVEMLSQHFGVSGLLL